MIEKEIYEYGEKIFSNLLRHCNFQHKVDSNQLSQDFKATVKTKTGDVLEKKFKNGTQTIKSVDGWLEINHDVIPYD